MDKTLLRKLIFGVIAFALVLSSQTKPNIISDTRLVDTGVCPNNSILLAYDPPATNNQRISRVYCISESLIDRSITPPMIRALAIQGSGTLVEDAVPTGAIDGVNRVFTLPSLPIANESVDVKRNGLMMATPRDFTRSGVTITFVVGVVNSGDTIAVTYKR